MDIGEKLFSKLWRIRHPLKSQNIANTNEILLSSIQARLTIIARAITKAPIFIYPSQEEGGWFGNNFYFPEKFNRYDNYQLNLDYYFFRIIFSSFGHLGSHTGVQPKLTKNESRDFCYDLSKYILPKIRVEFESFIPKLDALLEAEKNLAPEEDQKNWFWLWGQWLKPPQDSKSASTSGQPEDRQGSESTEITTEIEGVIRDEVEVVEFNKKAQEDYTLNHIFEKCLTAEDFNGNWRDFDGDDELEEHQEALEEVSMSHVIRVHDLAHSVIRSKLRLNVLLPEEVNSDKGSGISVKEWDFRKKSYRRNHCKVFHVGSDAPKLGSALQTLNSQRPLYNELLKKFRSVLNEREVVRRVPFGEELDLDAMVDSFAEIKAGKTMPENIYRTKRKARLNLAVSFLVDLSLSTDAFVDNERILDLEKRTLTVFGQVLDDLKLDFSIHGFYSETRNNCKLQNIKGFADTWREKRDVVDSIKSIGYTRMGPALRVLTSYLRDSIDAKEKIIIFITDGKPTDYDLYEGTYGINDVRMAIKEARNAGIRCCGLAMDAEAKLYFPIMMGDEPYEILKSPKELNNCLKRIFTQVISKY